jgi:SNF2 family DNA or RNA helicase
MRRIQRSPAAAVGISLNGGLLSLNISSDEFSKEEISDILKSYRQKQNYYRLRNGDYISLEDNAISLITEMLEGLQLSQQEIFSGEEILIPQYRACYIDQMLQKDHPEILIDQSVDYSNMVRKMEHIDENEYEVPKNLNGKLRGYQRTGYQWMRTLGEYGFGGILADDMGLGKTIQTIAYLLGRKNAGYKKPSLIICPASLVYNWQKELERFAPSLRVKMVSGTARFRKEAIQSKEQADVWITSYDMAKRDVSLYAKCQFDTQIIDEAQNIKNYYTQAAKAVKLIPSDIRFALTGTPIENRLSELWSIFDYLMPGILGSYQQFRAEYEIPVVQNESEDTMERLKKMVSAFILRRVKQDVLTELPEKIEQVLYAQMEAEQRKLYVGRASQLVESLQNQSELEISRGKIEILAELTRLRQICCDPRLIYEDFTAKACKVDMCEELIHDAVEGNNKVLIFSQFTSIFPILEEKLKKAGIAYYKLTGETPKMQRVQMAESFNQNQVPVFLISLKAGGTGLNLTGANIVIHFDPWWNIAAQNQATDRAHRIGQKNQVTVYKLIAKDTIEEKIIELQEKKKELAEEVLGGEGISVARLNREDLLEILDKKM